MRVNEIEPYLKDIDSISLEFADNIKKTKNIQGMVEDFYTTVTRWTLESKFIACLHDSTRFVNKLTCQFNCLCEILY